MRSGMAGKKDCSYPNCSECQYEDSLNLFGSYIQSKKGKGRYQHQGRKHFKKSDTIRLDVVLIDS